MFRGSNSFFCSRGVLRTSDADIDCDIDWEIPYIFFGTFDGHAGSACAVTAANELHQVRERIEREAGGLGEHLWTYNVSQV